MKWKEKILKFYYLYIISIKCSLLLFKHKRILRTVFSITFSVIFGVILLIFFDDVFELMESIIRHIDVNLSFTVSP